MKCATVSRAGWGALLLLLATVNFTFAAGNSHREPDTLYVSTTYGDPEASGAWNDPLDTIQGAIDQCVADEIVLVEEGEYIESIDFLGKNIVVASYYLTTHDYDYVHTTWITNYFTGCVVTFANSETNDALLYGFGIYDGLGQFNADPELQRGGGISCINNSNPRLEYLQLYGHQTDGRGGAIYCYQSSPVLYDIIGDDNGAASGAFLGCVYSNPICTALMSMSTTAGSSIDLFYSTASFSYLTLQESAGWCGIECSASDMTLDNATIRDNDLGIYMDCGHVVLNSCIVWDSLAIDIGGECSDDILDVDYCDIQGGIGGITGQENATVNWGVGNIDADPLFCPWPSIFSLYTHSPCAGTGYEGSNMGAHGASCEPPEGPLHVSISGSDYSGDGSEGEPFATIQRGVSVSVDDDTVLVEDGTYVEQIDFLGKDITVGSRFLLDGDENHIDNTIIDGDAAGCVVTFAGGETIAARLSGLSIVNGVGSWDSPLLNRAGGISCVNNSNPALDHLEIINNIGYGRGGGIYCLTSAPYLDNILFSGNEGTFGAVMYFWDGDPYCQNITIEENTSGLEIITLDNSSPTYYYLTLANNTGTSFFCHFSTLTLDNATIVNSGNIFCEDSDVYLNSCIMWDITSAIEFSGEMTGNYASIIYSDIQGGRVPSTPMAAAPTTGATATSTPIRCSAMHQTAISPCMTIPPAQVPDGKVPTWERLALGA